jgi:hypothetical protein
MEPAPSTLASRLVARPDPLGPAAGWLLLLWPTLSALWIAAGGFPGWHSSSSSSSAPSSCAAHCAARRARQIPLLIIHMKTARAIGLNIPEAVY